MIDIPSNYTQNPTHRTIINLRFSSRSTSLVALIESSEDSGSDHQSIS